MKPFLSCTVHEQTSKSTVMSFGSEIALQELKTLLNEFKTLLRGSKTLLQGLTRS